MVRLRSALTLRRQEIFARYRGPYNSSDGLRRAKWLKKKLGGSRNRGKKVLDSLNTIMQRTANENAAGLRGI